MQEWESITAAVAAAMAVLLLAGLVLCLICRSTKVPRSNPGRRILLDGNNTRSSNSIIKRVETQYSFSGEGFSWNKHPSLVAEALEHGWTTFAFIHNYINTKNSSSAPPWGLSEEPEITWEVVSGSNLMQKIRLNPGSISSKFTTLQTALPLPGPPGPLAFPPESYLEIAILSEIPADGDSPSFGDSDEDDHVKLLQLANLDHGAGNPSPEPPRLSDITGTTTHRKRSRILALGQSSTPSFGRALPGFDPGSVGFYSSGAVILNGILSNGADEGDFQGGFCSWGAVGSVVGCGFDPAIGCVFFTLNGSLVRGCRSQEFGAPLYPTIAANYDVTVSVNFGQRDFIFAAANPARLSDPARRNLSSLEDSREFFSMDRIDPLWLADKAIWPAKFTGEAADDGDLFDIVLDGENV